MMNIDFEKYADALVPAIVQDSLTGRVLMLGFMNAEALAETRRTGRAVFFSRSRQTLWSKGETSGNFLDVESILVDCDADTVLLKVRPAGPTCHTGSESCFGEGTPASFLFHLEQVILDRKAEPSENSYTSALFARGLNKIAQKVGEEAVELVIEGKDDDDDRFRNEAADLIYHLLVLLAAKNTPLTDVLGTLQQRSSTLLPIVNS